MKSVYRAVRTGSLNKAVCASSLKGEEILLVAVEKSHKATSILLRLQKGANPS
jgi:hypothetical protein